MCLRKRKKTEQHTVPDRYRRFEIAKRQIPINISPREYEEEIKRLARIYKI